jgi:hypothetical protein
VRQRGTFRTVVAAGTALLLGALTVNGCGSSGTNPAASIETGRATLAIRWPERSRLIPVASESIRVTIFRGSSLLAERLLTRPSNGGTSTADFDRLPVGEATFRAVGLPNADGSGVGQAKADAVVPIVVGQVVPVRITMASTIDRIEIGPANPLVAPGGTISLVAAAKNTAGEIVLTDSSTLVWTSQNTALATVTAEGAVTGVATGSVIIEAREVESGKIGTVTVQVGPSSSGDVKCDPATGHCYEKIADPTRRTFAQLRADAESRTYQGLRGHLATITSASEQAFVQANVNPVRAAIGAYQDRTASNYSEPGGGWRWITGEAWSYTLWRGGEPNNAGGVEDYHNYFGDGTWNDAADRDWDAYIVEYEAGTPGSGGGNGGGGNGGESTLLIYEGFDYPAGAKLENQTGGTGWRNPWNEYGQGHTSSVIEANGLTFGNLKTSGRAVRTTSRRPIGHARVPQNQLGTTGTVLYASILLRPVDAMNVGWPDTYFGFGFSDMGVGKPGRTGFYSIEKGFGSPAGSTVQAQQNVTVFLVFRVTFRDGSDIIEMWVNPTPGQPLPAPAATKSDVDVSLPGDIGIGSSIPVIFDEYRVGTSWEAVSPTG